MRLASPFLCLTLGLLVAIVVSVLFIRETRGPVREKSASAKNLTDPAGTDDLPAHIAAAVPAAAAASRGVAMEGRDTRATGSPLAAELNAADGDAAHDVQTLHALLKQYLHHLGRRQGLPLGNDSDLARALTGHNPIKLVVIPRNHPAISPDGRLRDRWGTPYFIHPLGNRVFEIRSAGADRRIFTSDDVVENPSKNGAPDLEETAGPEAASASVVD